MGIIPPPIPLTQAQWLANGKRDPELEAWLRQGAQFRLIATSVILFTFVFFVCSLVYIFISNV